jgi:hypothetical protein
MRKRRISLLLGCNGPWRKVVSPSFRGASPGLVEGCHEVDRGAEGPWNDPFDDGEKERGGVRIGPCGYWKEFLLWCLELEVCCLGLSRRYLDVRLWGCIGECCRRGRLLGAFRSSREGRKSEPDDILLTARKFHEEQFITILLPENMKDTYPHCPRG